MNADELRALPDFPVDAAIRMQVIERLLPLLREHYVFPEVAQAMEEAIRRRLSGGEYDNIATAASLCEMLTAHLQEVSHDKHLGVFYRAAPQPAPQIGQRNPEQIEEIRCALSIQNFGFYRVERLPGNIGYLDLRSFHSPEFGAETAVAAMNLVSHTSALIIDLRRNRGGEPEMIALISSYLFDKATHLNSLYWRAGDWTQQFWTLPYVPGQRYAEKPVYVLTSRDTASGAEEFAYNLKNLKRATIVGEVTAGAAHPGDVFEIDEYFGVFISTGRAVNPTTGTNWEGTGVSPDIEVPGDQALKTAHIEALKSVLDSLGNSRVGPLGALLDETQAALAELAG
jgi:hypothetical protein